MKKTLTLLLLLAGLTLEAWGETLTWNGSEGHMTWDWNEYNWLTTYGSPSQYKDSCNLVFGDTGSGAVALKCIPRPASVLVNSDKDYTFTGDCFQDGALLTKSGKGTLTINSNINEIDILVNEGTLVLGCEHAIEGSVTIAGGTLVLGSDNALGTGAITLGSDISSPDTEVTLDLNTHSLANKVSIEGYAFIGNGKIDGFRLDVAEGKTLTLLPHTTFEAPSSIHLGEGATLNLGGNTINYVNVGIFSSGNSATIGNGTIEMSMTVAGGQSLTLLADTTITGGISVKDGSSLDLGGNSFHIGEEASNRLSLSGSTTIGNGTIEAGDIVVDSGNTLTLCGDLKGDGKIYLGENATLNLGEHTLTNKVYLTDAPDGTYTSASIGNGTLESNLVVHTDTTLTLCGDLKGSGTISLSTNAKLDLGGHTLSNNVDTLRSATIGGGSFDGNLAVNSEKTLTLSGNLGGSGTITLGDKAKLDLGGHALTNRVIVDGSNTTITCGGGRITRDITVQTGNSLKLDGDLDGIVRVTLGANSSLDLGSQDRDCSVTVIGNNAAILNGKLKLVMNIAENVDFTLSQDSAGISCTIYLEGNNTLDLGDQTVYGINLRSGESATIGNGTVDTYIYMENDTILTLSDDISINKDGIMIAGSNSTVNLNGHTITGRVLVYSNRDNNNIGNGTIDGNVIVDVGSNIHFYGETHIQGGTVTAGNTTVKALKEDTPGLLQELTVSNGLIAGTDRQTSLADGLDIDRYGHHMELRNLILTDNNKISVGDGNTITLNNVTIKISDDVFQLVNGIYTIDLKSLINCDLEMQNVLLDASDLSLPQGFDLAKDAVAFDFGDDVSIKQATGLDMRVGKYWSPSLNLDEQGKVIFTKLVETPEPATGTLSLLALAALAARRRRK